LTAFLQGPTCKHGNPIPGPSGGGNCTGACDKGWQGINCEVPSPPTALPGAPTGPVHDWPPPTGPVHDSIAHHNKAFGALDVESILLDFTNDSVLKIFNQADGSLETWTGLAELRVGFTGLLGKFTNMSDVTVPVSFIEENSPQGQGGAFTAGSNHASGFTFFHDVFVADADGKLFRQDAFIHYIAPKTENFAEASAAHAVPGPVHKSIAHHGEAFGKLDVDSILLDFTDDSALRIFNQADGSFETFQGLAELRVGFTGLLKKFTNMSDITVPVSIIEENSLQGPGGAFTAGSNKASGFTFFSDAFVADANGKLFRQNAFIHHVAPQMTKEVLLV